jgi:hypothetical protein
MKEIEKFYVKDPLGYFQMHQQNEQMMLNEQDMSLMAK